MAVCDTTGHAADALPDMMDQEDMGEDMYNSMGRSRAGDMYNNSLGRPSAGKTKKQWHKCKYNSGKQGNP